METRRPWYSINLVDMIGITLVLIIVAAVFAPDWHPVQPKAIQAKCQSNMMNLVKAMKMYKLDMGEYPETLAGHVLMDKGKVVPFDQAIAIRDGLRGDYGLKTWGVFRCPNSPVASLSAVAEMSIDGKKRLYYAWDSYDIQVPHEVKSKIGLNKAAVHYVRSWADSEKEVSKYPPFPPGIRDNDKIRYEDWKKQLKWRYPPDDTVVTWCGYHKKQNGNRVCVQFLDGSCRVIPADQVEGRGGCRWRTRMPLN